MKIHFIVLHLDISKCNGQTSSIKIGGFSDKNIGKTNIQFVARD